MADEHQPQAVRELLTPKQVARAIGVSSASLKRWCDKGIIASVRTAGGHRRLPMNGVISFIRQTGHALVRPEALGLPATIGLGNTVQSYSLAQFRSALEIGDEDQARGVLFNLYLAGHTLCDIADKIIAATFHAIGEGWAQGHTEIYQERRAIEIAIRCIFELRQVLPPPAPSAPHAIGATTEGDPYTLPTTLIELVLREAGWRADSYGPNHPFETLARAIQQSKPRLLWLSVSTIPSVDDFLTRYATLYETATAAGVAIVVGGRALTTEIRSQMTYAAYCDQFRHLVSYAASLTQAHADGQAQADE